VREPSSAVCRRQLIDRPECDAADEPESDSEAVAELMQSDAEFIAALNRAKAIHQEGLRACLAAVSAADTLNVEEIGSNSAEGAQAQVAARSVLGIARRLIRRTAWAPGMI
jgi:hypothetical protein